MAYTIAEVFVADVFADALFTGVHTTKISHLDILNKRIFLRSGVTEYHPVTDIYREVRYHRANDESLRVVDIPVVASGNLPKGGGKFTPRLATFRAGWKVVPANESHTLYISGEQITDDGQAGPAAIDTTFLTPGVSVIIQYEPPASELVRADEEIRILTAASYNGTVVVDQANGVPGTDIGIGKFDNPVSNFNDAKQIASDLGLTTILLKAGTTTITAADDLTNYIIRGVSAATVLLIIQPGATITNCEITNVSVTGVINGTVIIRESYVYDINYFSGFMFQCQLAGDISIIGPTPASFMQCFSAVNGVTFDLNQTGHSLVLTAFNGDATFINKADTTPIQVYINSGVVTMAPSVTVGGGFQLDGVAHFVNNSPVVSFDGNRLVSTTSIDNKIAPRFADTNEKIEETQAFVLAS